MLVGEQRSTRTLLRRILKAAGYAVDEQCGPEAALARLSEYRPDAFVIDADMAEMGGIELCQRLREDPRFQVTPILLTTGSDEAAVFRRAFAAGCDDFLGTPLTPLVVTARLNGHLRKYDTIRQLDRLRSNLARYISPRVRQLIESSVLSGELLMPVEREVCILFSDIRGFTALSQTIPPELLFSTISRHLGAQVEVVYRHRGYVDKFGGDGIMAVFDGEGMDCDACHCALEILDAAEALQSAGEMAMPVGIGIHRGKVVAGNIGTGDHLDYSVIGNTVNLAARLCGYAHSRDIIVSEEVCAAVGDDPQLQFIEPRRAHIRGLREPIKLFRLGRRAAREEADDETRIGRQ